ncbi:MAG: hypothetical protein AAFZ15_09565 [Bacteroidota bacterium]
MITALYIAACLAFVTGAAHSYLGERYILIRLFRRQNLPKLLGGTDFTRQTLRFAWHITTVLLWGFSAFFILMANESCTFQNIAWIGAATFIITGAISLIASKGRHLSWIAFLSIGFICLYAALI